jgi:hypothetical protein
MRKTRPTMTSRTIDQTGRVNKIIIGLYLNLKHNEITNFYESHGFQKSILNNK